MAISDRITSIEEHIKESYQELEGIGIDTTGVNNNLENIPKLIDGYWETLPKVTGEGTSITLDNTKEGKMKIVLKGNTSQEGTPTPETPQDIHVVSGDNTIDIHKNFFDGEIEHGSFRVEDGTTYPSEIRVRSTNYINVDEGTYVFDLKNNSNYYIVVYVYDENNNYISSESDINWQSLPFTKTFSNKRKIKFGIRYASNGVITPADVEQIIVNSSNYLRQYPINLGDIELCKIGDYQDSIKKSTGKNLFENVIYKDNYIVASDGTETSNTLGCIWKKIKVKPNTTYTLSYTSTDYSFGQRVSEYNSSETFIQRNSVIRSPYTFTTTSTTEYINLSGLKTDTNIMINEGTTALDYEPYGTGWYKYNAIQKKIFTGTENWTYRMSSGVKRYDLSQTGSAAGSAQSNPVLCNYFLSKYANEDNVVYLSSTIGTMSIMSNNFSDLATFKNWLSNGNVMVYYALQTPTYTEITDSTLLSQLNALAKSYASQTNISQESNDLASILNATALEEM